MTEIICFSSTTSFATLKLAVVKLFHTEAQSLISCPLSGFVVTTLSSACCCFTFQDVNRSFTVINIRLCAASLGKQVRFQDERKQPHHIWHAHVITGGLVLGSLVHSLGMERCPWPSGLSLVPPGECSQGSASTRPSPIMFSPQWTKIHFFSPLQNWSLLNEI